MDDISEALDQQISNDLAKMAEHDPGSEERKKIQNQVSELYKLRIEERKHEADIESQNWARGVKLALEAAGLVVPNGVLVWSVVKCLKFESEGIVKAGVTRRVLNMIKPGRLLKLIRL